MERYSVIVLSPLGWLEVVYDNDFIYEVCFVNDLEGCKRYSFMENDLSIKIQTQLNEYFIGDRKKFDLPYKLTKTGFYVDCLKILNTIPYGETRSYKEIAVTLGKPDAARAVGNAMNKNPLPIIIPCHRVIGSNGKLMGFRFGLEAKKWLLDLEKRDNN